MTGRCIVARLVCVTWVSACASEQQVRQAESQSTVVTARSLASISGRLPGSRWREMDPPLKGTLQTFETIHVPEPCQLLLYAQQSKASAGEFMKAFASRLSQSGQDVVKRENLHLPSGVWLNFTAVSAGSVSRIYARKEGGWIIWVMLLAPDEKSYALFAPDAERYLAHLAVEYE